MWVRLSVEVCLGCAGARVQDRFKLRLQKAPDTRFYGVFTLPYLWRELLPWTPLAQYFGPEADIRLADRSLPEVVAMPT